MEGRHLLTRVNLLTSEVTMLRYLSTMYGSIHFGIRSQDDTEYSPM